MTSDSPCAYKAVYSDGKLIAPRPGESTAPKSCAGVRGTQILVEDLFYNVPTRKKAMKNPSEEHQLLVQVITKYAIHNSGISFSCKKHGESTTDVHTQMNNSTADNILIQSCCFQQTTGLLYGQAVARELIHIASSDVELNFKLEGHVTNASYNVKKMAFILFINHRLVESKPLKTALDSVYAKYLPKGTHPFVYLSLEVAPQNVDVNVHPTKQEVRFLHEDQIIEKIQRVLEDKLLDQNKSRTFYAQSLLPGAGGSNSALNSSTPKKTPTADASGTPSKTARPDQMVRTDSRSQSLTGFLTKTPQKSNSNVSDAGGDAPNDASDADKGIVIDTSIPDDNAGDNDFADDMQSAPPKTTTHKGGTNFNSNNNNNNNNSNNANTTSTSKRQADDLPDPVGHITKKSRRKHKMCELTSIQNMVAAFQKQAHEGLLDLFKNHIFVGCVDRAFVLIQYKTKLYLLNMVTLSKELIYQELFQRFGDLDRIILSTPVSIKELILIALDAPQSGWTEENGDKETIAENLTTTLLGRAEMVREYLSMDIDADGNLLSLPQILDDYIPQLKFLPLFILWLCTEVEWDYEVECFEGIARQMADFYCIQPETAYSNNPQPPSLYPAPFTDEEADNAGHSPEWVMQHVVFPALRKSFYPPKGFSNDGTIIQVAQLENLYKIFERC